MENKNLDINYVSSVDLTNLNIKDLSITIDNHEKLTKKELDDYFVKITNTFLKISTIQSVLDDTKNNLFAQLNLLENMNSSLKNQYDTFDILNETNNKVKNKEEKENKEVKKKGRKKKSETLEEAKEDNKEVKKKVKKKVDEENKEVKKRGRKKKIDI